jgi:hypothetical protein
MELRAHRVALFRTIQRNRRHSIVFADQKGLIIGHGCSSLYIYIPIAKKYLDSRAMAKLYSSANGLSIGTTAGGSALQI